MFMCLCVFMCICVHVQPCTSLVNSLDSPPGNSHHSKVETPGLVISVSTILVSWLDLFILHSEIPSPPSFRCLTLSPSSVPAWTARSSSAALRLRPSSPFPPLCQHPLPPSLLSGRITPNMCGTVVCEGGLTCLCMCQHDQGLTNGIEGVDHSER